MPHTTPSGGFLALCRPIDLFRPFGALHRPARSYDSLLSEWRTSSAARDLCSPNPSAPHSERTTTRHRAKWTACAGRMGHSSATDQMVKLYGDRKPGSCHQTSEMIQEDMKILEQRSDPILRMGVTPERSRREECGEEKHDRGEWDQRTLVDPGDQTVLDLNGCLWRAYLEFSPWSLWFVAFLFR